MKTFDPSQQNETYPNVADRVAANICLGGLYTGIATVAAIGSAYDRMKEIFGPAQQITVGGGNLADHDNPFAE